MVLRKLSQTLRITLALMVATFSSGLLQPAVAYATKDTDPVPGNNGTVKIHEQGSEVEDPSNEPKVCVFNFEGFGFDAGQEGVINIAPQGGDSDTIDTASLEFGPADADGMYSTEYINDGGVTLDDGHYKSTLYGKDANGGYTIELKAKSKNFKVECTTEVVQPAGNLSVDVTCEAGSFSGTVIAPEDGVATYKVNGNLTTPGAYTNLLGTYTVEMFVNGTLVDTEIVNVPACEDEVLYASPIAPTVSDVCGTTNDTVVLPLNTDQITYSLNANVVTATLLNSTTYDFGTNLNGYVLGLDGLTAKFTVTFLNNQPCVKPCVNLASNHSTNIEKNGWTLVRGAEYVDGGIKLTTPGEWVSGKISRVMTGTLADLGNTIDYSPDAQYLGLHIQTSEGWLTYETAYGGNWWLSGGSENMINNAPHTGGGQGSPYYGTLEEWASEFPELQVLSLVVLYTNAVPASVTVTSVTIGCVEYTFDKEEVAPAGSLTVNVTCEAGSFSGTVSTPVGGVATYKINGNLTEPGTFSNVAPGSYTVEMFVNGTLVDTKTVVVEQCEDNKEKYSICHATGNDNNDKYVFIKSISAAGIFNGHLGESHQNGDDIIPPFVYKGELYSQNWNAEGIAIYENDCVEDEEEPTPMADIDFAVICVQNGVKVTLTNSGDVTGTATVNGTVHTVAAKSSKEVVLAYDLGTPFKTAVTVTIGQTTSVQTVNCTPGQGGENPGTPVTPVTPTTPGQTLGASTTATPVVTAVQNAVLPAVLPATGGVDSPFMILVASVLAFGATYFLQGKRLLGRREAIQA